MVKFPQNTAARTCTFPSEKTSTCPLQKGQCCRLKQDSLASRALKTDFKHIITACKSIDVENRAIAVLLHVLDCMVLPAHTFVCGRLQQNKSVLASLLPQTPSQPHAESIVVQNSCWRQKTRIQAAITTPRWACGPCSRDAGKFQNSLSTRIVLSTPCRWQCCSIPGS